MTTFASDNYAGAHPDVVAAVAAANVGHAPAYGADPWTARARELLREQLDPAAESFLVFNGTGANVLALRAACRPWGAAICAQSAHLQVDEGGAPERMGGIKLLTAPTPDGKLTPADVERLCARVGDEHQAQPHVVSIAQSTELGTLYTPAEIRALADAAHARDLFLHLDGARLPHAAAALGLPLRALTGDAGVDLVSFGATKVGALGAEAVVVLGRAAGGAGVAGFTGSAGGVGSAGAAGSAGTPRGLAEGLPYLRKQSLQLASKGRFLAAQFVALLEDGLWERLASHANAMAARLASAVESAPGLEITQPVQANAVFAQLPLAATATLLEQWRFYDWETPGRAVPSGHGEVRWMCSWDTDPADVDRFAAAIRAALAAAAAA